MLKFLYKFKYVLSASVMRLTHINLLSEVDLDICKVDFPGILVAMKLEFIRFAFLELDDCYWSSRFFKICRFLDKVAKLFFLLAIPILEIGILFLRFLRP